ncbi:hypothetical protein XELAEV_18002754mg [Xenopus laevis]|nr:hypothetical protein XELAEV_18002754mg [Xenopus laevis]
MVSHCSNFLLTATSLSLCMSMSDTNGFPFYKEGIAHLILPLAVNHCPCQLQVLSKWQQVVSRSAIEGVDVGGGLGGWW